MKIKRKKLVVDEENSAFIKSPASSSHLHPSTGISGPHSCTLTHWPARVFFILSIITEFACMPYVSAPTPALSLPPPSPYPSVRRLRPMWARCCLRFLPVKGRRVSGHSPILGLYKPFTTRQGWFRWRADASTRRHRDIQTRFGVRKQICSCDLCSRST